MFIGFNGIPLINQFGEPILGPGELYDRDNKVVKGLVAIVPKDKYGNDVGINKRLQDIKSRYGEDSEVYKKCLSLINNFSKQMDYENEK